MKSISIGQFSGGHSRSDRLGKGGSYIYGENIDNITDGGCIQVSQKEEKKMENSSDKFVHILNYYSIENREEEHVFFFTKNGKVYKDNQLIYNFLDNVDNQTLPNRGTLFFFPYIQNSGRFYFIAPRVEETQGQIKMLPYNLRFYVVNSKDISDSANAIYPGKKLLRDNKTVDLAKDFYVDPGFPYGYLNTDGHIFTYSEKTVTKFKYDKNIVTQEFSFFSSPIVSITKNGSYFRIYTVNGTMYLWDGNSNIPDQVYEYKKKIRKVVTLDAIDYVIGEQGLWVIDGVKIFPLYRKYQSIYANKLKFQLAYPIGKCVTNNFLHLFEKTPDNKYQLVVFGNLIPGEQKTYTIFNNKKYDEVTATGVDYDGCYVAYKKDGKYGVDYYNLLKKTSHQENGFLITKEITQESIFYKGKSCSLKVYCDLGLNGNIQIEYSINRGDFEELANLNENTPIKNGAFTITNIKREWHTIVFRITLTHTAKLYDLILEYE